MQRLGYSSSSESLLRLLPSFQIFDQLSDDPATATSSATESVSNVGVESPNIDIESISTIGAELPDDGACWISIGFGRHLLLETPDVFGQTIIVIPQGAYAVEDVTTVSFGGLEEQRWFQITVDSRNAWIRDSTFAIEAKTAACP
jgi:hypothetical protein